MLIEKDVPIPSKRGDAQIYPFDKMEVGDSIFFPGSKTTKKEYVAARVYAMRHADQGIKFTARTMDGGVRIWRTA